MGLLAAPPHHHRANRRPAPGHTIPTTPPLHTHSHLALHSCRTCARRARRLSPDTAPWCRRGVAIALRLNVAAAVAVGLDQRGELHHPVAASPELELAATFGHCLFVSGVAAITPLPRTTFLCGGR